MFFQLFSAIKVELVDEMVHINYLCYSIYMLSAKKLLLSLLLPDF